MSKKPGQVEEVEDNLKRARDNARAGFESIRAMVERLRHCRDCRDEECDLSDEDIHDGLNVYHKAGDKATEEERADYHDEDAAIKIGLLPGQRYR